MTSEEQEREATLKKKKYLTNCLYVVGFLDLFGIGILIPLLARHASSLGASPTIVGLIGSVYGGLQLLSGPVVGKWSDIRGRRFVLLWCLFLSAVGYAFMAFAFNLIMMVISRIAPGLFKHSLSLVKAYLAEITVKEERPKVFGRFNAISSIGFIIGPVVGGHLADRGFSVVAMCTSSLFFINFVLVFFFVEQLLPTELSHSKSVEQFTTEAFTFHLSAIWKSFREIFKTGSDIFLIRFLLGSSVLIIRTNYSLLLEKKFDATAKMTGWLISYGALISMLFGFLVGPVVKYYDNLPKLFFHSSVLLVITLTIMTSSLGLPVFVFGVTLMSISNPFLRVIVTDLSIQRAGLDETGTLLGISQSVMSVARTLAPFVSGLALEFSVYGPGLSSLCLAFMGMVLIHRDLLDRREETDDKRGK